MPPCGPQWQKLSEIEVNRKGEGPRDGEWNLILIIPFELLYPAIFKATM